MPRFSGGSERPGAEMTRPSSSIVPPVGSRKPAIMRSVVVLPQPEGPSSETNSPRASASVARSTAVTVPNRQVSSRSASLLAAGSATILGARTSQHEVAANHAKAEHHERDGDDDEHEADRREHLEVALIALVEQQDREHLGAGGVEKD